MPGEHKLIRCEVDAPNRCQSGGKYGQCPYTAEPGKIYCARHGGAIAKTESKKDLRIYRATQWKARIAEHADNPNVKSLREEIGVTRLVLDSLLTRCTTDQQLVLSSHKISHLVMTIERLVTSCDKLENKLGLVLDRTQILQLADLLADIVGQYVEDPDVQAAIGNEIIQAILTPKGSANVSDT